MILKSKIFLNPIYYFQCFFPNSEIKINQIYKPAVKYSGTISNIKSKFTIAGDKKIFTSNKIDEGWNGDYKGAQAPIDTYTYYAIMKTDCGSKKSIPWKRDFD